MKEYEKQKKFLESSNNSLKRRYEREEQLHKSDNTKIMQENEDLIRKIDEQRIIVKDLLRNYKKAKSIEKQN